MKRYGITIAGQSGQGVDSMGRMLAFAFKRLGFHVLAYREYQSLIKGGNASYRIDFSPEPIHGVSATTDIVLVLNKQLCDWHLPELNQGGCIIHDINDPLLTEEDMRHITEKRIQMVYIPAITIAKELGGNILMANIAELGLLWSILGLPKETLQQVLEETFSRKPQIIPANIAVMEAGFTHQIQDWNTLGYSLNPKSAPNAHIPAPDEAHIRSRFTLQALSDRTHDLLIGGNEAIGLGAVTAGVRAYFAYPMTPASSILSYLAEKSHETGMIVRQAEDEISAAALTIGASFVGTRAMTGTSGGGYDLMTEHTSLAGILETPFVCVIAQRPGPATGLPTWTCQGDLLLAVFAGHGEYPRIVMSCSDPEDAYYLIQDAHNLAEEFQIPVLFLTEKMIAESLYTIPEFDESRIPIERYITDTAPAHGKRYEDTPSGISARWLPGTENPDYDANSDEHDEYGNVDESGENAIRMMEKRYRKVEGIKQKLPKPVRYDNELAKTTAPTVTFIGWGSVRGPILDTLALLGERGIAASYLHVTYLWPFPAEEVTKFLTEFPETILVENNYTAQFGQLIRMETGKHCTNTLVKYDGRPLFVEDVLATALAH